jgi:hypothetical protein
VSFKKWIAVVGGLAALAGGCWIVFALALSNQLSAVVDSEPLDWTAIAARFHRGPEPCLRYWKTHATDAEIQTVVDHLLASGVSCEALRGGASELVRRGLEIGSPAHAASEADELAQVIDERLSWSAKASFWLLRKDPRKLLAPPSSHFFESASQGWAELPAVQQQALDGVWKRTPTAFVLPNIVPVLTAMNVAATRRRLATLADQLGQALVAGKSAAEARRAFEALPEEQRRDCWGTPLELTPQAGKLRLRSLGRDLMEGGEGADADLVREVAFSPSASAAAAPPAGCSPLPHRVDLDRAEIAAAFAAADFADQARVVPAFEGGKVVGFRLLRIAPSSLYARAGLCEGDVVTTISGFELTDPAKALEAYGQLQDRDQLEVGVRRGDVASTLSLRLH